MELESYDYIEQRFSCEDIDNLIKEKNEYNKLLLKKINNDLIYSISYAFNNINSFDDNYIFLKEKSNIYINKKYRNFDYKDYAEFLVNIVYDGVDNYKILSESIMKYMFEYEEKCLPILYILSFSEDKDIEYTLAFFFFKAKKLFDFKKEYKYLKAAADKGHVRAIFRLGTYFFKVEEVKDDEKAFYYLKKAADLGDDEAIKNYLYLNFWLSPYNTEENKIIAQKYALESVRKYNSYAALCFLGNIYNRYDIDFHDYKKSFDYYQRANKIRPDKNLPYYKIGLFYYYGYLGEKNLKLAKQYIEIANSKGGNYEFILELINSELGIDNSTNFIKSYLSGNKGYLTAKEIFDELFEDVRIDEDIKTYLITALDIYINFANEEKKYNVTFDYSPCIVTLFKSMECVIRKYLIDNYRAYLKKNVDPEELQNNKYLVEKDDFGKYRYLEDGKFKKFTLGDFEKLIGLKNRHFLVSSEERSNSVILPNVDGPLVRYSKEVLFDRSKLSRRSLNDEINNYYLTINNFIKNFIDEVRNPATHNTIITKEKAEIMINYFLFTKKIFVLFYKNLKRKLT